MMAKQLKQHGIEHQLVTIPGGEHGLGGGDPKLIAAAYKSAGEFVDRYLKFLMLSHQSINEWLARIRFHTMCWRNSDHMSGQDSRRTKLEKMLRLGNAKESRAPKIRSIDDSAVIVT